MMMHSHQSTHALVWLLFFALLQHEAIAAIVPLDQQCRTNEDLDLDGRSEEVLRGCLRDRSDAGLLRYLSEQFISWIGIEEMYLYISLTLAFIPMISWWSNPDPEIAARVSRIRFGLITLLFRLSLAQGVTIWFMTIFQSKRPCECKIPESSQYVYVGELEEYGPWGMPNTECVSGTMISLYLFENFLPIPGLILLALFPMTQMSIGYSSLVQSLVGIAFGTFLHYYLSRTLVILRVFDFVANIAIGFSILSWAKGDQSDEDFSWANTFVFSILWQMYAISLLWIYFDQSFLNVIAYKSITGVHQVDFIHHMHGEKHSPRQGTHSPAEQGLASFSLMGLFALLIFFRILTKDFDSWLD
eukprot:TRINITY_DN9693_c0_g1_i1.p1 TRINITY_DN9693_c0_g1~~TRINITY_DN9693_c0_g1_i1.p1  ORF type:complete len:358 (+),score=64.28 TRINITY_DN9693_c0_g1_i1:46-1119(+)